MRSETYHRSDRKRSIAAKAETRRRREIRAAKYGKDGAR